MEFELEYALKSARLGCTGEKNCATVASNRGARAAAASRGASSFGGRHGQSGIICFMTTLKILHVLETSLPLHSGYGFRTLSIIKAQRHLGWQTFHLTGPKHDGPRQPEETVEGLKYYRTPKPRGVLTTVSDPQGRSTVVDLVQESSARLFPVGRLDLLSEGLVLLTNDGPLAHSLLHPSFGAEREYRVTVRGSVDRSMLRRISEGVEIEDGLTAPARVGAVRFDSETRTTRFALTLVEGRKRQIRRMMRALGHPVVRLVRVRMGPLELGRLAPGKARPLRARERRNLNRALLASRAEEQPSGN